MVSAHQAKVINSIKARLGAISPSKQSQLYGAVARLILEDLPWLLNLIEESGLAKEAVSAVSDPMRDCYRAVPVRAYGGDCLYGGDRRSDTDQT